VSKQQVKETTLFIPGIKKCNCLSKQQVKETTLFIPGIKKCNCLSKQQVKHLIYILKSEIEQNEDFINDIPQKNTDERNAWKFENGELTKIMEILKIK